MRNWLLVLYLAVLPARAADPVPTKPVESFTDPDLAGANFKIQGEYGSPGRPPGKQLAAQVIADGDGKFNVHFVEGGLPGAGWSGRSFKRPGITENGTVRFVPDDSTIPGVGEIKNGQITMKQGGQTITLSRVVRHSPTEGAKPPAAAIILFDGAGADAWDHGKVENGLLSVSVPGGQSSKRTFSDCTVHVEFILPFMPRARGQGRANSGVYLQGRYEVQVLDSFGLEGKDNECGGIYEVHAPKVNMCYPPLQWQTYDIDFTAARFGADGKKTADARMTVKHNGVLVQEKIEIPHETRAAVLKEGPEPGPIHLQNHGNPIFYRNVWVVEKK